MMKLQRLKLGLLALSLCAIISCKDEEKEATPASAQTENEPAAKTTGNTGNDEIKVNPAHGLPGHRCDLPVGAPLNGTASTQQTNTTQQVQSSTVSPIRVDQTPKVNPPHGEPGHDCAKPVGAKLDN